MSLLSIAEVADQIAALPRQAYHRMQASAVSGLGDRSEDVSELSITELVLTRVFGCTHGAPFAATRGTSTFSMRTQASVRVWQDCTPAMADHAGPPARRRPAARPLPAAGGHSRHRLGVYHAIHPP